MANNVNIKLGFAVDSTMLSQLKKQLQEIVALSKEPGNALNKEIQEAGQAAEKTISALGSSLNSVTNTLNTSKFNKELAKSGESLTSLYNKFSNVGASGANAYNIIASSALKANVQIKKSNKLLDNMAVSMANTVKWGITSGIWNTVTSSLAGAVTYVEKLDHSLNDIRIVTEKNAEAMRQFAKEANNAAQNLGASTTSYTDAALIYYQQGLSEAEVKARTEVTMKTANVTRQSADEVSEQLTAVWNGYKVSAEEAELYVDKLAAVAATTAADLEELSTGMSKVASAASSMGVDIDQLNAQLATIVSVTRQAPESVGTALKTIYARMGDLQIDGEDEFGVTLGAVSGQLAEVGINVLDQTGNLRDMGVVMEEVAAKWDIWNESQRTAVAIAMAGKRQYNNLIALFDNWDMYSDALDTSVNSLGTLQKQQDIYLQSTDAKLQKLTTRWESLYSTVIDTDELNTAIDAINGLVQALTTLAGSLGGGFKTIGGTIGIIASLGSNKIAEGLINKSKNRNIDSNNISATSFRDQAKETGIITRFADYDSLIDSAKFETNAKTTADFVEKYEKYKPGMSNEDYQKVLDTAKQLSDEFYEIEENLIEIEVHVDKINDLKNESSSNIKEIDDLEKEYENREKIINDLQKKGKNRTTQENKDLQKQKELQKKLTEEIRNKKKAQQEFVEQNKEYLKTDGQLTANAEKQLQAEEKRKAVLTERRENVEQDYTQQLNEQIGDPEQLERQTTLQLQTTALAGAYQMVAGSIMAVNSAWDIWTNDDLSIIEKLTQSLLTLTPVLTMAWNGFTKLRDAKLLTTKASEVFSLAQIKETALTLLGIPVKQQETEVIEENTEARNENNDEIDEGNTNKLSEIIRDKGNQIFAKGKEGLEKVLDKVKNSSAGQAVGGFINKIKTAFINGAKAIGKVISSIFSKIGAATLGSLAAIAAVAVAGIAIYVNAVRKKAEKELKKAREISQKATEEAKEATELAKNTSSLADAIAGLNEKYKEQGEFSLDLRLEAVELAKQYGDQKIAVDALTMSYEQLQETLKEIEKTNINSAIAANDTAMDALNNEFFAAATKNNTNRGFGEWFFSDWFASNKNTIEFSTGLGFKSQDEKDFLNDLKKVGFNIDTSGTHGTADFDVETLIKNWDTFENILSSYSDDLANHSVLKAFERFHAEMDASADSYASMVETSKELNVSLAQAEVSAEDIIDIESYRNKKDEIIKITKEAYDNVKDAENAAIAYLMSLGEEQYSIAILSEIQENLTGVTSAIQNWTEDERNYIYLHLDSVETMHEAEQLLSDLEGYFNISKANTGINLASTLLKSENHLEKKDVESLFDNSDIGEYIDIDSFVEMGHNLQKSFLLDYISKSIEYIDQNQKDVVDLLQQERAELEQNNQYTEQEYAELEKLIDETIKDIIDNEKGTEGFRNRLNAAYIKEILSSGLGELDSVQSEDWAEFSKYLEYVGNNVFDLTAKHNAYTKALAENTSQITQTKNATNSYNVIVEESLNQLKKNQEEYKNIASAYQTITKAIEEYNEYSAFNIDTINELINLNPEYLDLMTQVGEQYELNEEYLNLLIEAKKRETLESYQQYRQNLLNSYLQKEQNGEYVSLTTSLEGMTLAIDNATQSWKEYAAAQGLAMEEPEWWADFQEQSQQGYDIILNSGIIGNTDKNKGFEKEVSFWNEDFDRYWEYTKANEEAARAIENLREEREQLEGTALLESYGKENEALEEQIYLLERTNKEQLKHQKELQDVLSKDGIQFNEDGSVANYKDATRNRYNQYVTEVNNAETEEEYQKAEDNYKDFIEKLEEYDELYYNNMIDLQKEISDARRQMLENDKERLDTAIQQMDEQRQSLKDLDSAYDSLTSIIDDYNSVGQFTLDSLDTLLSLEPEYLSLLQMENGQLSLNVEATQRLGMAKVREAQAQLLETTQERIAYYIGTKVAEQNTITETTVNSLTTSLQNGTIAWEEYWNAALSGMGVVQADDYINDLINDTKIAYDGLEQVYNSFQSGDLATAFNDFGEAAGEELEKIFKKWEDEFDRYWNYSKAIEKVTDTIEKLRDIRKNLYDDELIENLKTENKYLELQADKYNQLLIAQKAEQTELQTLLSAEGVVFNAAGEIVNYATATQQLTDSVNELIDSASSQDAIDDANERFEDFKENIERYDELFYDEMKDTLEKLDEISEEMIDNNFEIWTIGIEQLLEKAKEARDISDYHAEIENNFKSIYKDLDLVQDNLLKHFNSFITDTLPVVLQDIAKVEQEISKIAAGGESEMFHSISQAQEYLKEKQQELRDMALETKDVYEDFYKNYMDSIDQSIEKVEDLRKEYDRMNESLEYQSQMIELLYGSKAYDLYNSLYEAQLTVSQENLKTLIEEKAVYEELYKNAEEGTQEQLKYKERLYELETAINEQVVEHIELLQTKYANTVENILSKFENDLTNGIGFNDLEEEWDRIKKKADKYYDTVEGLYQIQTLNNKITQSINSASIYGQSKLQALHDREIKYLKDKKNLTEYDIKAAEARYQITLKEIALEEAQQNKNTMKLVRDTQGNWTYQYVANQEDIAARQQELLDTLQGLYQLSSNAYSQNIDSLYALHQEYIESAREIANDETLTEEQKLLKLEELRARYIEDYKVLAEENELYANDIQDIYLGNLLELFQINKDNIKTMSEDEQGFVETMVNENITDFNELKNWMTKPDGGAALRNDMGKIMTDTTTVWNDEAQKLIEQWNGNNGIEVKVNESIKNIKDEIGLLQEAIELLEETTGKEFGEEGIQKHFNEVESAAKGLREAIVTEIGLVKTELTTLSSVAGTIATEWNTVKTKIDTAIAAYQAFKELTDPSTKTKDINENFNDIKHDGNGPGAKDYVDYTTVIGTGEGSAPQGKPITEEKKPGTELIVNKPNDPTREEIKDDNDDFKFVGLDEESGDDPKAPVYKGTEKEDLYSRDSYSKQQEEMSKNSASTKDIEAEVEEQNTSVLTGIQSETSGAFSANDILVLGNQKIQNGQYYYEIYNHAAKKKEWISGAQLNSMTNSHYEVAPKTTKNNINPSNSYTAAEEEAMWKWFEKTYNYPRYTDLTPEEILEYINQWKEITGYDTGGYTGNWGSASGRIAILHEKELVLNKSDTANILSAVSAIRSIAGLNSSINDVVMQGISRMMLEMNGIRANANYNTEASQNVGDTIYEIHAEFPDANDVNSIREAILSLPSLASQRISRYTTP